MSEDTIKAVAPEEWDLESLRRHFAGRWPEVDQKTVYVSDGELFLMVPVVDPDTGKDIGYSSTLLGHPSQDVAVVLLTYIAKLAEAVEERTCGRCRDCEHWVKMGSGPLDRFDCIEEHGGERHAADPDFGCVAFAARDHEEAP